MDFVLKSCACLTLFFFAIYSILRIVRRYFAEQFMHREKHLKNSTSVKDDDNPELRRNMGLYESYLTNSNKAYGTKIYSVLCLKSPVSLRRDDVKNSLILLARKHPILQARVAGHDSTHASIWQFVINTKQSFIPDLRFVNTSNWQIILEEELSASNDHPVLWKTIVLREQYTTQKLFINTLLFLFSPVVVDRISLLRFMQDFVVVLCQFVNCDISVNNVRTVHLPEPAEDSLQVPSTTMFIAMFKQAFATLQRLIGGPVSSHKKARRHRIPVKPLIVLKDLSEQDTTRLLKYCSSLNCSLIALFLTAWTNIMSGRTGSTKALGHRKPVKVVTDYGASKKNAELAQYELSNCSSFFELDLHNLYNRYRNFRSTVRDCEYLLQSALQNGKHLELMWQFKYDIMQTEMLDRISPLEIADIGRFNFSQTWPFSLHNVFVGAQSTSTLNLTLVVINNKLYCTMHLNSHFSGCSDILNILFARIVQYMSCKN